MCTITVRVSFCRSRITNGPVPLAWREATVSSRSRKFCGRSERFFSAQSRSIIRMRVSLSGIEASGARVTISTVSGSTATTSATVST